jgi:hypothetical protein
MRCIFPGKLFRGYRLSLVIDKLSLEMAYLLGLVSELVNSVCGVGQSISMNHVLQFVDVFSRRFPTVHYVCVLILF